MLFALLATAATISSIVVQHPVPEVESVRLVEVMAPHVKVATGAQNILSRRIGEHAVFSFDSETHLLLPAFIAHEGGEPTVVVTHDVSVTKTVVVLGTDGSNLLWYPRTVVDRVPVTFSQTVIFQDAASCDSAGSDLGDATAHALVKRSYPQLYRDSEPSYFKRFFGPFCGSDGHPMSFGYAFKLRQGRARARFAGTGTGTLKPAGRPQRARAMSFG